MEESRRGYILSLVIDALKTGKAPELIELDSEERKVFDDNFKYLKGVKERMGDEEFSKVTIDTGYDY